MKEDRRMRPRHWLYTIPLRLRSLFRWAQADQELDDELRDHLDRKTEEYVAQGMTQEEAHRRARLDLGGIEQTKEKCRDARRVRVIETALQDIRFGMRMLRKNLGFTSVAVLVMALGIGANAAMFSVVNAVLLRPLSFNDPGRIVTLASLWKKSGGHGPVSAPDFRDWHDQSTAFEAIAYYQGHDTAVMAGPVAEYAQVALASREFFRVFHVLPAIGREFNADETKRWGKKSICLTGPWMLSACCLLVFTSRTKRASGFLRTPSFATTNSGPDTTTV